MPSHSSMCIPSIPGAFPQLDVYTIHTGCLPTARCVYHPYRVPSHSSMCIPSIPGAFPQLDVYTIHTGCLPTARCVYHPYRVPSHSSMFIPSIPGAFLFPISHSPPPPRNSGGSRSLSPLWSRRLLSVSSYFYTVFQNTPPIFSGYPHSLSNPFILRVIDDVSSLLSLSRHFLQGLVSLR